MPAKNVEATEDGWDVAVPESGTPLKFKTVGEHFTGNYIDSTVIEFQETVDGELKTKRFNQHQFVDSNGEIFTLNGSYKIDNAFLGTEDKPGIVKGSMVRITHTGLIDVGQPSPMKDFKIEVKKA